MISMSLTVDPSLSGSKSGPCRPLKTEVNDISNLGVKLYEGLLCFRLTDRLLAFSERISKLRLSGETQKLFYQFLKSFLFRIDFISVIKDPVASTMLRARAIVAK
jgi:hypothetical protein